ncbi:hypothetical protein L210DRAFT_3642630 [Boletus edulis BED1]|uniref:Uncharacterized protein n=1 Tax=Boletus edulis BED1 TaxID=1328754 RepID=A0AAD4C2B4_BOLED|nr:hypothetical protein L210DRAFT_3642630 [Boletus edulis BED1]
MPNCPQCLKHFSTDRGVAAHLVQKTSKCNSWERGPVALSVWDATEENGSSKYGSPEPSSPLSHSLDFPPVPDDEDFNMDFFPNSQDAMNLSDEDEPDNEQANSQPSATASTALLASLGLGHQVQFFHSAGKVCYSRYLPSTIFYTFPTLH